MPLHLIAALSQKKKKKKEGKKEGEKVPKA